MYFSFSHIQLLFQQQSYLSAALAEGQGTTETLVQCLSKQQGKFSLALKPRQVGFEMCLPWEGSTAMIDTKSSCSGGTGATDAQQMYFGLP